MFHSFSLFLQDGALVRGRLLVMVNFSQRRLCIHCTHGAYSPLIILLCQNYLLHLDSCMFLFYNTHSTSWRWHLEKQVHGRSGLRECMTRLHWNALIKAVTKICQDAWGEVDAEEESRFSRMKEGFRKKIVILESLAMHTLTCTKQ